jgi:DNA polymerase sigma
MSNNRIILVIKASDIDVSSLPEDKRDIKSRAFKDAVYDHLLKNYGVSGENIIVHIQNDIITIDWSPQEKMNISMLNSRGHCACSRMAN